MNEVNRIIGLAVGPFVLGCLALAAGTFTGTTLALTQEGKSVSQRIRGCTLAGTWKQTAEGIGSSIWKIDDTGKATEDGLGFATGTATLTGTRLRLDWKIADAWAGYYEWQLDSGCNSGEGELVFTKGRTGTHKTSITLQAGLGPAVPAQPTLPVPTPTPIPPVDTGSSKGMSKYVNEPDHSPDKLEFGEVWEGQSYTRSFRLTANASGYVRAEIPTGPFRVAEIRTLGPEHLAGGKGTGPMPKGPIGPIRDLKSKGSFEPDNTGPWGASLDAGDQLQIYVVFAPKVLFDPGEKTAAMKVAGPGPVGNWVLTIPLSGVAQGSSMPEEQPPKGQPPKGKLITITKLSVTFKTGEDDLRSGSQVGYFLTSDGHLTPTTILNCDQECNGFPSYSTRTFELKGDYNFWSNEVVRFGIKFYGEGTKPFETGDNWDLNILWINGEVKVGSQTNHFNVQFSGNPLHRFITKDPWDEWMTPPLKLPGP